MRKITDPQEGFWRHVDKTEPCWNWTANKDRDGYGRLRSYRRDEGAHRVSWELHRGPIPKDAFVLHQCDNPSCVNPDHLFLGNAKDNMHDCLRKNRRTRTKRLSSSEVTNIRSWFATRPSSELKKDATQRIADHYGVSWYTVRGIISGANRTLEF